ncbi:MAG: serine hydrolase, partial [Acidobacteria bacterium]|nr:serine hydrolase [Acidobacteriota bacterium]
MNRNTATGPVSRVLVALLPALVFAAAAGIGCSPPAVENAAETVYPDASWERIADPASAGFSAEALEAIHPYVEGINTTAVMAVVGGRVLFEHGRVDEISYLASVRKSILAMLYGRYVEDGTIDLELTVADLGMDDVQGLMPIEKQARVLDLVTARSGVYHPASNSGDNLADAPPRGSQEPGTYYLYSNWDFNAA